MRNLQLPQTLLIVDLRKGYSLIELDEGISFLNTFITPFSRFRFTRMPHELIVAEDKLQHKLDAIFSNLDFCTGFADNMITWGEQQDASDHDKCLIECSQVSRKYYLKLDKEKSQYKTKHAGLLANTFMSNSHKPENEKIQAINKMPQPTNVKGFQCFLDMVNYSKKYPSRLAKLGDSMRDLTKKCTIYMGTQTY